MKKHHLGIGIFIVVALAAAFLYSRLGQAGFAGLGALLTARISADWLPFVGRVPALVGLLLSVVTVAVLGFIIGWPTIRRRGLFLALTTFAIAAVASRFVFQQPYFTTGLRVGVLASGSGTILQAMFERGDVPIEVVLVDRECGAVDLARAADVAVAHNNGRTCGQRRPQQHQLQKYPRTRWC